MTKDEMKKIVKEDFEMLKKMSIPEYTLFRKWEELNTTDWDNEKKQKIWEIQQSIWIPEKPEDYLKLEPDIINVQTKEQLLTWTILRKLISTMHWNQNVGRLMRFTIYDKVTKKYLGVISLASDFISLSPRDEYIGWDYTKRIKEKMLNHTAMGSSIVPTQPLGYNYVGGKLITLILGSDKIEKIWNSKYKETLTSITTTSLYGGYSQYNGLKHWKKCGTTTGEIPMEQSNEVYKQMRIWIKENYPEDFEKLTVNKDKILSRPKSRLTTFGFKKLGVKPPINQAPRGVYVCNLYKNSCEFLSKKDKELKEKLYDNKIEVLVNLWKEKYAKKRIDSLIKTKRTNFTTLFYSDIINKTWKETKEKYLKEVGR